MKVEIARSVFSRLRGLLGRRNYPDLLVLTPCNDIHTFGMRSSIDVAFIDSQGTVIEAYRRLGRCRRVRCSRAESTLERIAADSPWFEQGEHVELKYLVKESL